MIAVSFDPRSVKVTVLSAVAIALLAVIFYSPIWWVSLTAPNYPVESFPDGVRIQFHVNGVFNGCRKQDKQEIQEEEALDCVHEMDTINHYVGMYPIAAGGPVEKGFGQFLITFLGVMLLGFSITRPAARTAVLGAGFAGIALWMTLTIYADDGFNRQSAGYVESMMAALDQAAGEKTDEEPEIVIGGITGILKKSLEDSGVQVVLPSELERQQQSAEVSEKHRLIEQMKTTYDIDLAKSERLAPWNGSSLQVMSWHYGKNLGRYFNNQDEILPMVANLELAIHVVFWGLIGAMVLLLVASRTTGGLFYWLLVLVPMALPLFFVIDYSAWLWWYGHTLNDMGAFTVKPFMPTVFGDGKVAQFATHSYPDTGFFLMLLSSVVLALAALIRRKQLNQT